MHSPINYTRNIYICFKNFQTADIDISRAVTGRKCTRSYVFINKNCTIALISNKRQILCNNNRLFNLRGQIRTSFKKTIRCSLFSPFITKPEQDLHNKTYSLKKQANCLFLQTISIIISKFSFSWRDENVTSSERRKIGGRCKWDGKLGKIDSRASVFNSFLFNCVHHVFLNLNQFLQDDRNSKGISNTPLALIN